MRKKILLIEDRKQLRESIARFLKLKKYTVHEAEEMREASEKMEINDYDIFILDIGLPDGNGLDLLKKNKTLMANKTIMMTANNTVEVAVNAMKYGACDYLEKPVQMDHLLVVIRKALELNSIKNEVVILKKQISSLSSLDDLIYESVEMREVAALAKEASENDNNVLLMGETGVGKDKIAKFIHNNSKRKRNEFLEINCSTLVESLIDSELFGYKKGAFTGANTAFKGRFIQADKGTLFLNEIGELPVNLQPKFLSVIESKKIMQIGVEKPVKSDFRLISATNRDLEIDLIENNFRMDLFQRLKEQVIVIPPLRERKKDILILFRHFLKEFSLKSEKKIDVVKNEAKKLLMAYDWPGNVRELKQITKIAVSRTKKNVIDRKLIADCLYINKKDDDSDFIPLKEYSDNYIKRVLILSNNNIKKCADILKISRNTVYKAIDDN